METKKYKEFLESIKSKKLKENIQRYYSRLQEVNQDEKIKNGLNVGSQIRKISQDILFDEGVKYIWLVPIETSIDEYSRENFTATNPYNKKTYSLVQSPQIQKEAAAVTMGSNYRLVDCYRGEKTDATHSNIFQQIDIEFANKQEDEIRRVAGRIITECFEEIAGITLNISGIYSYCDLMRIYDTDSPNIGQGFLIEEKDGRFSIGIADKEEFHNILPYISSLDICSIYGNNIVFEEKVPIEEVRKVREKLILLNKNQKDKKSLLGYWISDMPYAKLRNDVLTPVHHVMSKPKRALEKDFNFLELSDEEMCALRCNSFDLMVCDGNRVVEILGGDERINSFEMQYDAIKRLNYNPEQYAYLLQTLKFNDDHDKKLLGGFAIGVERLAQFLSGTENMRYVQLFPTNLPNGELLHATSIEDLGDER